MTDADLDGSRLHPSTIGLVPRARALVETGTTEMADGLLHVPLWYYRDADLFERERTAILATTPLALAPTCRLSRPHDYLVRDVLGRSVLLTRDGDGRAHAFLNYCRHRGARPAHGAGSSRRFTCPYHAWSYDSGGQLVGLPGQEGFAGLDRSAYGLVELPSEERNGFVWVVLTVGADIDVAAHLGPLDAELAQWDLHTSEHLTDRTFTSSVNWKSALEAFAENYHFAYVHAASLIGQNTVGNTTTFDSFGVHHRLAFPSPWIEKAPDEVGSPLDHLSIVYWVYPDLVLAVSVIGTEIIEILPGDDPGSCSVRHGWMATHPATDEATRAGYLELYEAVHAAVRDEDFTMLPSCGDAIRHAQHDHMVIGRNEIGVQNVVRAFADALQLDLSAPRA
ncbi:MAG: aromatic ring-hydroxylating oxygenase subunit alpha [Acidimicrobiales bacterium]